MAFVNCDIWNDSIPTPETPQLMPLIARRVKLLYRKTYPEGVVCAEYGAVACRIIYEGAAQICSQLRYLVRSPLRVCCQGLLQQVP